uniref:SC35-like splicing factor family protein n=1 Tax=Rhizophora mucronata TaxID=61149 RepID=A0A2P2IL48_RHIMU
MTKISNKKASGKIPPAAAETPITSPGPRTTTPSPSTIPITPPLAGTGGDGLSTSSSSPSSHLLCRRTDRPPAILLKRRERLRGVELWFRSIEQRIKWVDGGRAYF